MIDASPDGPNPDGPPDAAPDSSGPSLDLILSGTVTYDTSSHILSVNDVPIDVTVQTVTTSVGPIVAITTRDLRLMANTSLRATGGVPLAIVANTIIFDMGSSIDVSGGGAGMLRDCATAPRPGADDSIGGGGGGGGSYGGGGGDGGDGHSGAAQGGLGGGSINATTPQGGCPGARGGAGMNAGGDPGQGGGAIYLHATEHITVGANVVINANGAGGKGGPSGYSGCGGGGSGGAIWLDAASLTIAPSGKLVANGGGGGGGGDGLASGQEGTPGQLNASPALGGPGAPSASAGSSGGSRSSPQAGDVLATVPAGGGGGGGGVGFIRLNAPSLQITGATISPASS